MKHRRYQKKRPKTLDLKIKYLKYKNYTKFIHVYWENTTTLYDPWVIEKNPRAIIKCFRWVRIKYMYICGIQLKKYLAKKLIQFKGFKLRMLSFHLRELEKEEWTQFKASRKKEALKIRTKNTMIGTNCQFFRNISNCDKH